MRPVVLYFTVGCYDKGGISRYNRYQITALREFLGPDAVRVYSVRGPSYDDFETPFEVTWCAGGASPRQKLAFVARATEAAARLRPRAILAAHVNLAGLAVALARAVRARSILNVYGREVWSGLRTDAAWGLRGADLVLADCHFTRSWVLEARLRAERAPMDVLWDCVDTSRFTPGEPRPDVLARYGIPDPRSHVNVLTLGRISRVAAYKGYERLVEAFRRARGAPRLRLVYAGAGDLVETLRERAAAAGLAERVTFTGAVHEDDLADVYRACHVFSLVGDRGPGRGEGIPLTPLEAAACGRPLLVGNQDGSREAVVDGEGGWALDPFDLDAQADRLARLAADGPLRERMGAAARRRILEHHDYRVFRDHMARHLERGGRRT